MLRFQITEYGRANGVTHEWLGFIPTFLSEHDERSAAEQIDANYQHGGGWRPRKPSKWLFDTNTKSIAYPGDSPLVPLATAKLRDETIWFYDAAWTLIEQPDGSFEIDRLD